MIASLRLKRLVKYLIVGLGVNGVALLVFSLLIALDMPVWIASLVVYFLALLATYLANYIWSFGSSASHITIMPRFLAAYLLGAAAQVTIVWTLNAELHVKPHLSQLGGMIVVPFLVFAILEWTIFQRPHYARGQTGLVKSNSDHRDVASPCASGPPPPTRHKDSIAVR